MDDYLHQIKELADQLTLASSPIDEGDLVLLTLNGLPYEFDALKTTVRARVEPISLAELTSLLCFESIHIESKQRKLQSHESSVVYVAQRGSSNNVPRGQSSFRGHKGGFRGGFLNN